MSKMPKTERLDAMEAVEMGSKTRYTLISVSVILLGGIVGFYLGGAISATLVAGTNPVSAATIVTLSAIGTGMLGSTIGLFVANRLKG